MIKLILLPHFAKHMLYDSLGAIYNAYQGERTPE